MDCLRSIVDVRRIDSVRNADVRKVCGVQKGIDEIRRRGLLGWFGHVERMDENRVVKKIYESVCEGSNVRGRPKKSWREGVNECLQRRGAPVLDVGRLVRDREGWRREVRLRIA